MFFRSKKTPLVGLDVTSTSVKLLELSRSGSRYRVEHHAVEPLPPNSVSEKNIADVDAVAETIRRAVKRSGTKNHNCAMAVAGSAVITKIITMPSSLGENELEAQVQLEADQYIPYALDEVNLDFEVIGSTEGNPETVDVLLAASRSENVEMRVAAAESAGLTPKIVDVEPYTIENAYPLLADQIADEGHEKSVALFDIGATMTSLEVLNDRKMIYTREQAFGGKQLTEEIMRRYGLTYEEAGLAKKEGGLPDNYVTDVLDPFKETVAQQINRFLQFYFSASQANTVDQIILAGGSASLPGIDEMVEARIRIPTNIANPFSRMSTSNRVSGQNLAEDAPSLMIACGLALRSFD